MALLSGLRAGLCAMLLSGLNAEGESGPGPFPSTAAGFAELAQNPLVVPSVLWLCDEPSGNLVDEISSETLVPAGTPSYDLVITAKGVSKTAVECGVASSVDRFAATTTSLLDPGATSVAYLFVGTATTQPSALSLFGKGAMGSNLGVHAWLGGATGNLAVRINDGITSVTASIAANAGDGNAFYLCVVVDRTLNELRLFSNVGTRIPASIAAITTASGTANPLYLGRGRFGSAPMRCGYFLGFEGAAAEAIDQTALDNFWAAA